MQADTAVAGLPPTPERTGATVLRRRQGKLDLDTFVPEFVQQLKMPKVDAATVCMHGCGILLDNIAPAAADAISAFLRAHGEDCLVIPAADVLPLPPRHPVHAAHLSHNGVRFIDAAGHAEEAVWGQGVALALGHVTLSVTETEVAAADPWRQQTTSRGVPTFTTQLRTVTEPKVRALAEVVFRDPPRRCRVDAGQFDYSLLGPQEKLDSEDNVLTLARWLNYAMPAARTNFDSGELLTNGRTELERYESEHRFDQTVHWLLNLAAHDGNS